MCDSKEKKNQDAQELPFGQRIGDIRWSAGSVSSVSDSCRVIIPI